MKNLATILVTALCALPLGCRSSSSAATSDVVIPCTCGQPETDLEGCAHPTCLAGETNPANPDCVCGTFSLEGKE
jgi:hypothetical protein